MRVATPTEGKVIVDGVNVAKKHQKPTKPTMQGGIIDKDMPIARVERGHRLPDVRQADPRRLPLRRRRHQGPHLPQANGGGAVSTTTHDHRTTERPRLKQRYNDEIRDQLKDRPAARPTSCRCPASRRS